MSKRISVTLLFFSFIVSGCFHAPAPFVPANKTIALPGEEITECHSEQTCLQVLIMYGERICAHAALRLQHPNRKTLFWDPAGGYGKAGSVQVARDEDLIVDGAPNLNEYIFFRTEIETSAAEIFEWQISQKQAVRLYKVLANGTDNSHPHGSFSTQGVGFFCASHVSDFLERFAADILTVNKEFFPHNLAKQLYIQSPDRVIVIDFGERVSIRVLHKKVAQPFSHPNHHFSFNEIKR